MSEIFFNKNKKLYNEMAEHIFSDEIIGFHNISKAFDFFPILYQRMNIWG